MNALRGFAGYRDRALLWLASALVLGAGYVMAFACVNAAIDAQDRSTAGVRSALLANARILARRPLIAHQESVLATRLRDLGYQADKPTTVARFIGIVSRIAPQRAVSIVQIDGHESAPPEAGPAGPAGPGTGAPNVVDSLPLEVTLRGSYRALLATIRDLAQAPLVMRIDIATIERTPSAADADADGPLLASLHVVLERLADPPTTPAGPTPPEETAINARPL